MRTAKSIELSDPAATPAALGEIEHSKRAIGAASADDLAAAEGLDNRAIARELDVGRVQVGRWRERFANGGLETIEADLPRSRRRPLKHKNHTPPLRCGAASPTG